MKTPGLLASMWLSLALPLMVLGADDARQEMKFVTHAAPDPDRGATLFAPCASCHGADGNGSPNGNFPRIAGQHYSVLFKQIVDFRYGKRWDFMMEEMVNRHLLADGQDVADV